MKHYTRGALMFIQILITLPGCVFIHTSTLTLDDFSYLEKGMTIERAVERLGEPDECTQGSAVFLTCEYRLEDGGTVYLGYLRQADYLDTAYYYSDPDDETSPDWIIPDSLSLSPSVERSLTLSDFEGLVSGMEYFPTVYGQVGPPDDLIYFEGGRFSFIYHLQGGGRVGMNTRGDMGCITRIGFSLESSSGNWTILSEDTQGLCDSE